MSGPASRRRTRKLAEELNEHLRNRLEPASPQVNWKRWADFAGRAAFLVPDTNDQGAWVASGIPGGVELHYARRVGDKQSELTDPAPYPSRPTTAYFLPEARRESAPVSGDVSDDAAHTPAEVLERVRDQGAESVAFGQAVIDAEVVAFGDLTAELLQLLRGFIDRHRNTTDNPGVAAVAAAVRKYIGELPVDQLDEVAGMLDGTPSETVELEVAKMVARKLSAIPPVRSGLYPLLSARVSELVEAYAHPRHLKRPESGAILLNGILAAALLQGGVASAASMRLTGLPDWFRRQVRDRASRAADQLAGGHPDGRAAGAGNSLRALAASVQ